MDIPVGVEVHCADGLCGRSTNVLIDPLHQRVTHLVVQEAKWPHTERLVPIRTVSETAPDVILLSCSQHELHTMDPFIETEYIREEMPDMEYRPTGYTGVGPFLLWPYAIPNRNELVPVERQQIPPGELAIKRGTSVEATDGRVGRVDELLVNPDNGHITHLVMREGHLWGQEDVSIPVSQIDYIEGGTVYLKLSKEEIEALPVIAVRRWRG
jgi:sporulation protein YlmC with PRC-barrel domain